MDFYGDVGVDGGGGGSGLDGGRVWQWVLTAVRTGKERERKEEEE